MTRLTDTMIECLQWTNEAVAQLQAAQAALSAGIERAEDDDEAGQVWHLKRANKALSASPGALGRAIASVKECGASVIASVATKALIVDDPMDTSRHPTARDYPVPPDAA